ncbi:hypothetical protein [Fibrobacter sp. UWB12]|uniref:hypothetical protein n=1 Tax=Fibrobacter sp. UWB12 TaxID=1896203 RepID=UPI00091DD447|nr:hypothetical protein [Fibrobacter sp. UWB12]SHK71140.1 hypothetical protein SAMN05720759_105270 [Fibrobacter sp. UWB12]
MKKILSIILLTITFSFAIKCTDALLKIAPAIYYLNHNYIIVQENYLDIFREDTSYREVYIHWDGTISNHKFDWYENTRFILRSQKEDPPYSLKTNALDEGESINYTENNSAGHLVYNRFNTLEDKIAKKPSPYFSSDIAFTGDTLILARHRLTDDKTFISKLILKNDSLFYLTMSFYGASQDTVVEQETSDFIYTNNSENEGRCIEFKYNKDSLKFVLNNDPEILHIKTFTQHGDSIIFAKEYPSDFNSKTEYVFLPIEKVLEKGGTIAIKKKNFSQFPTARKNHYYDLKGRTYSKQIPYRVFF